ncbi:MAG TPA: ribbon-helix-helix domain-containing protein [Parvibaculum sp.]|jgi:predicted DNA-binding ribbon-helix-helix protein
MPAEIKRSVTISGHRTSISLERPFWDALKEIACTEDVSVNELVRRIDAGRDSEGNLSGAVRVYILAHFKNKSAATCA